MKNTVKVILAFMVLSPLSLSTSTVSAAEPAEKGSDGYVNFRKKDSTGEEGGDFYIKSISPIHFKDQLITGSDVNYFASYVETDKDGEKYLPTNITVVDDRGSNVGWDLTASITEFSDEAKDLTLDSAVLSLQATSGLKDGKTDDDSLITEFLDEHVELSSEESVVLTVPVNKGYGTSTYFFGESALEASPIEGEIDEVKQKSNSSVQLSVPGKTVKNKDAIYKAVLTWTLKQEPSK